MDSISVGDIVAFDGGRLTGEVIRIDGDITIIREPDGWIRQRNITFDVEHKIMWKVQGV